MKKTIAVLLSQVMLLSLAACGTKAAEPIPEPEGPEERITVANPVHEATAETVLDQLGITMNVPEECADTAAYSIIDGEPAMAQVVFTSDGVKYCYRMKSAAQAEDISGMYFNWSATEETTVDYCPATLSYNENAEGVITWFDVVPGMAYSLSVSSGATADGLKTMALTLFAPLQGDVDPEPAEDVSLGAEFDAVLERIGTDVHPGTAGSSLVAASFAGELCDLLTTLRPDSRTVLRSVVAFESSVEDTGLFEQQLGLVCGMLPELLGENGKGLLESCGYTPTQTWDAPSLTDCFADLNAYLTAKSAYAELLENYGAAKTEAWDAQKLMEKGLNYMAKDSAVGYQVADLDQDGTFELLIGCMDEGNDFTYALVLDLYTLNENGETKTVFQSGERSRYYYAGEDLFAFHGSSGAADSVDNVQKYAGGEMTEVEGAAEASTYVVPALTPFAVG